MSKPSTLIITGYGLNCEEESRKAWEEAGAHARLLHLKDLLAAPAALHEHDALMFIGGFSFGDHMGSGHAFSAKLRNHLQEDLATFIEARKLVLGICNGFQIMVKLGLLPGLDAEFFAPRVALIQNDCGTFQNFWVTLGFEQTSPCIFTRGMDRLELPIRHGEGKLFVPDNYVLNRIEDEGCAPCRYIDPDTRQPAEAFPHNPNGSTHAIAGLCDPSGRVFGMMPHPEAFVRREHHPRWDLETIDADQTGLQIFRNAVDYLAG